MSYAPQNFVFIPILINVNTHLDVKELSKGLLIVLYYIFWITNSPSF